MPKVGKMKFPYTEQGIRDAKNYSKQSGKPMQVEGSYRHGGKVIPKYNMGGLVKRALADKLAAMYKKGGKVKK